MTSAVFLSIGASKGGSSVGSPEAREASEIVEPEDIVENFFLDADDGTMSKGDG